ncbi:nuclear transport factor 2 family protein [Candidatus Methylocalor cossyra]|uniref:Alternative dihydrofolate reductase 3 n=1 Tax=Candidatus Methylocalor cossyra TaxID=3108543 RepID=A0ABP1C8I2_9GAMM
MNMDATAVLFANEAFYHAFSQRDFPAMERLWAREWPVVCIHPGWPALTDYTAILESWRRILGNPATGTVIPHHARALLYGPVATVLCYEEIQGAVLVASNAFVIEGGEIRIVHHHASPCAHPPPPEAKAAPALQ